MSFATNTTNIAQSSGDRPRCRICGKRLKTSPWRYLGIGPVCVRKYRNRADFPQLLAEGRAQFAENRREKLGEFASQAEIDALDAMLRSAGVPV